MHTFVVKGDFVQSEGRNYLGCYPSSYLVCVEGRSAGVYPTLPEQYRSLPLYDYTGKLILCGLVDLHLHAPQYTFQGMGMDMELLDWLNHYTFPEEMKYAQIDYAIKAYDAFVTALRKSGTTRVSIFGTAHVESTEYLMSALEGAGIKGYVGLVSMDRNAPQELCEGNNLARVEEWLQDWKGKGIEPILTPRFIPSCSDVLMEGLGRLQRERGLPLQSHLSENLGEIAWVKELLPHAETYGHGYDSFGCFGTQGKTVMAHCVHWDDREVALMKKNKVYIAHCPESNSNLSSGIAPIKRYLEEDLKVGLGSDIAGGHHLSLFAQMAEAIKVSKLRWRLVEERYPPLTVAEVYYMATKGGGSFFGAVGNLEVGNDFDIIVLEEEETLLELNLAQRLERAIYLEPPVQHKYVAGEEIVLKDI